MELVTGREFRDTQNARMKRNQGICRESSVIYIAWNILWLNSGGHNSTRERKVENLQISNSLLNSELAEGNRHDD